METLQQLKNQNIWWKLKKNEVLEEEEVENQSQEWRVVFVVSLQIDRIDQISPPPFCKTCFSISQWFLHAKNYLVELQKFWDWGDPSWPPPKNPQIEGKSCSNSLEGKRGQIFKAWVRRGRWKPDIITWSVLSS